MIPIRSCTVVVLLALSMCTAALAEPLEVFWVRHAEKELEGSDPALTSAGQARAQALANLLIDARIDGIHSTDYLRTRQTAAPLAEALGLAVELYDPRDLPALIEKLRARGGRHLVVGHSNTTPAGVELMGGEPGSEIVEATEYDRLYLVSAREDGVVSTLLFRYGEPSGSTGTTASTSRDSAGRD